LLEKGKPLKGNDLQQMLSTWRGKCEFHHLYEELRNNSRRKQLFHGYARMLPDAFDYIANAIRDEMDYSVTNFQ
jgi:hypothetical protein